MSRRLRDWLSLISEKKLSLITSWRYGFFIRYWYVAGLALFLLMAWTWCCVIVGPNGWRAYRQKKAERRRLQTEIEQLKHDNEELERRVRGLQSDPRVQKKEAIIGGYVPRRATVYRMLNTDPKATGSQNSPKSTNNSAQSESRPLKKRPAAAREWVASNVPIVLLTILAGAAVSVAVVHSWLRRARRLR